LLTGAGRVANPPQVANLPYKPSRIAGFVRKLSVLQLSTILLALAVAIRVSPTAAIIAYVVAICSQLVLAYISRPFNLLVSARLNYGIAVAAALAGIAAASLAGPTGAIVILAGAVFIAHLTRSAAYHHPGALTPVWLAVTGLLVEAFTISYIWIGQ
jgi:hypothetical protein